MGLLFYPRGGSSQVALYLSRALMEAGWEVVLASGSLGPAGERTHAATFFEGVRVEAADYTPALERFERGEDQLAAPVPFHGSYEDREGVPDLVFTALGAEQAEAQVAAWEGVLGRAGFGAVDVIHLHHLTPMHEAVARRWPERPLLTHLHGTELKMLDRIGRLDGAGKARDRYARDWASRLEGWARRSRRIICISPTDAAEAVRLLGVSEEAIEVIPNGVDTDLFDRRPLTAEERLELLRLWLVDDPQGWDESGVPGSIRYPPEALASFTSSSGEPLPVLMFVGRFLGFKHVPLLVRAYARAQERFETPAPLLVWGGSPGEWEGEHPHTVAEELGVDGVFFTGWRGHDELPQGLSCADVFVAPSVDEPFGQVFLEAMACGVPVITTRTGGPLSFVNTVAGKPNGWLVEPDDVDALADALVEAVNDEAGRRRRAEHALEQSRSEFSWRTLAERFDALYTEVAGRGP
jgi:glycosyltransferase involved in cell wall biosynthesis